MKKKRSILLNLFKPTSPTKLFNVRIYTVTYCIRLYSQRTLHCVKVCGKKLQLQKPVNQLINLYFVFLYKGPASEG